MHDAGERFYRAASSNGSDRGLVKVRDDMRRQQEEIGVRPHHHQVHCLRAKIFLASIAVEARVTGRGRRRHDRIARLESIHVRAHFGDHAGKLMTEGRRYFQERMPAKEKS